MPPPPYLSHILSPHCRYLNLGSAEQKRLEINEDSLLVSMLYNTVAFMTMMSVSKNELKRKVRRLLAKSHIGLVASEQINTILECVQSLVRQAIVGVLISFDL